MMPCSLRKLRTSFTSVLPFLDTSSILKTRLCSKFGLCRSLLRISSAVSSMWISFLSVYVSKAFVSNDIAVLRVAGPVTLRFNISAYSTSFDIHISVKDSIRVFPFPNLSNRAHKALTYCSVG